MENGDTGFEKLYKINVNEHVERKNGLQYLPWSYAWAEVKRFFHILHTRSMKQKTVVSIIQTAALVG